MRVSTFGRGLLTQSLAAQIMEAAGTPIPETSVAVNETTRCLKQGATSFHCLLLRGGGWV